jgi:TRAP transporter TAXI family solute receptor
MLRTLGTIIAIVLLAAAGLVAPLSGQPKPLIVSTGDPSGTYVRFFSEMIRACPQPALQGMTSKGSLENVERLENNQVNLAFAQIDVLYAKKLIEHDPLVEQVRTFLILYLEEVHILIPSSSATSIRVFSDLAGKRVGTYGGGSITSRILFSMINVTPASLQDLPGPTEAVQALGGTIDAVIGVGGKPLPWVAALNANYKLVPFTREMYEKVSNIYFPGRLEYSNLDQVGPVPTIGVPSMLITKDYKSPEITKSLLQLRGCIFKNLAALRETVGNHPKWGQVDPANIGPWPYFGGAPKP